ncbi:class I SAM-dependent methyltransferase [Plantibacter sp. VKM Ac-2885]|uniref:class I SAM-dependent methyltransferase n=1 Tax=Plantibacter sp. VKM Ac-2885 TaxID=2783828 RepID=UPI00188CCF07|nr:methyltransferase domain-containing protein [Plantibacter sp. VKM Ac-2885]MBF4514094.1 class I SAM-dependent methyltransferase [Plantibacter sp. VKM Ac-2885]
MTPEFDKQYWEAHWAAGQGTSGLPVHPALDSELADLVPGTAIDAGSGEGAEAAWLAANGWTTTAVDISAHAITRANTRPTPSIGRGTVAWVEADLTVWEPDQQVELVTTFYAHPSMSQHAFYERISQWVAPGGTLLIVGHHHDGGHGQPHPENAVTGPEQIRALFDHSAWIVHTAETRERTVTVPGGSSITLRDVIARVERI